ncbi:hypothetical protein LMG26788_02016 [Achromobacter pulmonis]|uniref:Uncharacterized protein n=1 Tax=Achromobacter pulmonis TaxID=1389932 RepID=A0A6S7CPP6_9BURK|nr:hypothetical protein LMG26788_02016 [Achromobacter pulmonis]
MPNKANSANDAVSSANVAGSPQPLCGARMMPQVSSASAALKVAAPGKSRRPAAGSRDSRWQRVPSASAMAARAITSRKMLRQP